jgi:hypothetical protein
MTAAINIRSTPPTLWCRETSRVIQGLFWGGWACYEATLGGPVVDGIQQLKGERVGVAECYSQAQDWLFGRDDCVILTVDDQPLTPPEPPAND